MIVVGGLQFQGGNARSHEGAAGLDRVFVSYEATDDIPLLATVESAEDIGVKRDTKTVAADWVYSRNAADENIVNRLRFHKRGLHYSHSCLPAGVVVVLPGKASMHGTKPYATNHHENVGGESQNVTDHGEHAVNTPNPSTQISRKSAQASSLRA